VITVVEVLAIGVPLFGFTVYVSLMGSFYVIIALKAKREGI
jgi:hypothetical protein